MPRIDRHTDYLTGLFPFEQCLAEGERERLTDAAARDIYGDGGYWLMPLGDLFAIADGDVSPLVRDGGTTAFDVYRINGCAEFVEQLITILESLSLKPTADEARYGSGTREMSFENSVRVFARDYFGLHDF